MSSNLGSRFRSRRSKLAALIALFACGVTGLVLLTVSCIRRDALQRSTPSAGPSESAPAPAHAELAQNGARHGEPEHPAKSPEPPVSEASGAPGFPQTPHYPADQVLSPLTADVVEHLRTLKKSHPDLRDNVFAKIGDSVTASGNFLYCFGAGRYELAEHQELKATIERFSAGNAAGSDPFRRTSEAAMVGWSAWQPLVGKSPALMRELSAVRPRYAFVMFGTNDVETSNVYRFADRMFLMVRSLTEQGVIPILSTIMPRRDREDARRRVPLFNAVIRGIAEARRLPLINYHYALTRLPDEGISRDGVHPTTYRKQGLRRACDFTAEGLRFGYNVRNLWSLKALHALTQAIEAEPKSAPEPRAAEPQPAQDIQAARPFEELAEHEAERRLRPLGPQRFELGDVPFVDFRPPEATKRAFVCDPAARGSERTYRFVVKQAQRLQIFAYAPGTGPDPNLCLFATGAGARKVVRSEPRYIAELLQPGEYELAIAPHPMGAVVGVVGAGADR